MLSLCVFRSANILVNFFYNFLKTKSTIGNLRSRNNNNERRWTRWQRQHEYDVSIALIAIDAQSPSNKSCHLVYSIPL